VLLESKAKIETWNNASVHFAGSVRGHRRHLVSVGYIASIIIIHSRTVVCCSYADIWPLPFGGLDNSDKNLRAKSKHSRAGRKANEFLIGGLLKSRNCFESKWT
jgi:hypothetical protein